MTPAQLARTVVGAVRRAVDAGELTVPVPEPADVRPQRPRLPGRGDWATGIALRLARHTGQPPAAVAGTIALRLAADPGIARVQVAPPGFLNITLAADAHAHLVRTVRAAGVRYGHGDALAGQPADPHGAPATGPRAAATRRLRTACGAVRETPAPSSAPSPTPASHAPACVASLGADATAWAHVRPAAGDPVDLDPATHLPQRHANPLFRIRYAHARTRALLRNAADLGFTPQEATGQEATAQASESAADGAAEQAAYGRPAEAALLAVIADYPRIVAAAARTGRPDALARALEDVADAYFDFQDTCAVLPAGDEKPGAAHRARLALADATGTVLAGGLTLLGISAPDHL